MQLQRTRFVSLLATIIAMAGFAMCIGSCLYANTTEDISWTFEAGLVLWGCFAVLDFCIVFNSVKADPKIGKRLKFLIMAQEVLKLILLSEALFIAIRLMMLPVAEGTDEAQLEKAKDKLLKMASCLFAPVMFLQVLTARLQNIEKRKNVKDEFLKN